MDNNNFPQDPNLNQNNNQQPQQPFNAQPQQPFNAQPQQPFNQQPQQPFGVNQQPFSAQQQNNPFSANNGGHNFNTQPNNPFMTTNNYVPGSDPAAHTKGIISLICGAVSILLNLIGMIAICTCSCNLVSANDFVSLYQAAEAMDTTNFVCIFLIILSLVTAVVAIVMAALGKKTSNDPLLTAGLVLGIIGAVLTLITFIMCSSCSCLCDKTNSAASSYSSYSSLLDSLIS